MGKILVGKTSDIPSGKMTMVSTDGKDILVTNVDGNYYAMNDTCTHAGASLSEGSLDGSTDSTFAGFAALTDFFFVSESGSSTPASPKVKITSCSG